MCFYEKFFKSSLIYLENRLKTFIQLISRFYKCIFLVICHHIAINLGYQPKLRCSQSINSLRVQFGGRSQIRSLNAGAINVIPIGKPFCRNPFGTAIAQIGHIDKVHVKSIC